MKFIIRNLWSITTLSSRFWTHPSQILEELSPVHIAASSLPQLCTTSPAKMITHAGLQPTLVAEHRRGIDLQKVLRLLFGRPSPARTWASGRFFTSETKHINATNSQQDHTEAADHPGQPTTQVRCAPSRGRRSDERWACGQRVDRES